MKTPRVPLEIRLRVLGALDHAVGDSIRDRIKQVAERPFIDQFTQIEYRFTWRTISTWYYRYKKNGITTLENKTRSDKHTHRKVQLNQLAEAINEVLPSFRTNKKGKIPKIAFYRRLLQLNMFTSSQISQTNFYRMVREHDLLNVERTKKLRQSFAMRYANELWQADTMYGPAIKQPNGTYRKTFLIAFIDDASRLITHAEFFYRDNTENMIDAFRSALFKRGRPERLYFDNGSNYRSKEILQACVRLDILLSYAPIRDGAAKGKIERFFRGFRDRFLVMHPDFDSLEDLNQKTHQWVEEEYNDKHHSSIQMHPLDRFNIDHDRLVFLTDDEYTEEIFYFEQTRKVSKTNVFSIQCQQYECPVDLRGKQIQVRFDRARPTRFIVYFKDKRMGEATKLDTYYNAYNVRQTGDAS